MITQREVVCVKVEEIYTEQGMLYNYHFTTKIIDKNNVEVDTLIQVQLSSTVKDLFRVGKFYLVGVEQTWQPQILQPPSPVSPLPVPLKQ